MPVIDMVVLISSVSTEMILSSGCLVGMSCFFFNICNVLCLYDIFFYFAFIIQPGNTDELQVCLLMYSVPIKTDE